MTSINNLSDIDGDVNHFNALYPGLNDDNQSKYYDVASFNSSVRKSEDDLALFHLNVRSLYPKLDLFISYISLFDVNFDAICLSEVWLDESKEILVRLPNYNMFNMLRSDRIGGGVSIFIRDCFQSQRLDNISFCRVYIECVFVKVTYRHKTIVFGCLYHPPNTDFNSFMEALGEIFLYLSGIGAYETFICGDFNIDMLNVEFDAGVRDFLNLMSTNYLCPVITRPSRVDDINAHQSLIDNIFCRNPNIYISGLLVSSLSDHYPVFLISKHIFRSESSDNISPIIVKYRSVRDDSLMCIYESLLNYDFSSVYSKLDVDEAFNEFDSILMYYYNLFCPVKSKTISYKDFTKPWIDWEVKREIRRRENYYKLFKSGRLSRVEFNFYRNRVTDLIRRRKREYYCAKFEQFVGDLRRTWSVINEIISPNAVRSRKTVCKLRDVDANLIEDDIDIANTMNDYFSTIGANIANSFDNAGDPTQFLRGDYPDSFFFSPATVGDIKVYIMALKNKKCAIEYFPTFLLKELSAIVAPVLCHLTNLSISSSTFPDLLKVARVVPLPKGGDSSDPSNYRPISVLHILSKIVEKHVHKQLYSYLESRNILNDNQFGFRYGRSTCQAVLRHTEYIYEGLNAGDIVFAMYLDFKKAFDSVDHGILLRKLYHYGVRGAANDWFKSYLTNRRQFVSINGVFSSLKNISHSVPQGSNLGPLLFLVYINDFPNCTEFFDSLLFADDSTVSCKVRRYNLNDSVRVINDSLLCVSEWLSCNRIRINISKTKYILYSYRGVLTFNSPVMIGDNFIGQTESVKFLGVYLDNNLNFKYHVMDISKKISRNLGIIYRIRDFVPEFVLRALYYSLINPYILYALEVWFNAPDYLSDRIKILQKKAIRIVNNLEYNEHTTEHFRNMNLLPLDIQFKYNILVYMHRAINEPNFDASLGNKLIVAGSVHNYPTRFAHVFLTPSINRERTRLSLHYSGVVLYNDLSDSLKNKNIGPFKYALKRLLLGRLAD